MNDSELVVRPRICREFTDVRARYEMEEEASGRGQHSSVHRAVNRETGETVAIKVTRKSMRGIEHSIRKEMDALRAVSENSNIMSFIELHEDETHFYSVLEWIEGGDLCERLSGCPGGHMQEAAAARIIRCLFRCLETVHSKQIIHRDVKLTNIMFATRGGNAIRLIDFGAAEFVKKDVDITKLVGTQKYLPPEMFSKRGYGVGVDIWSAGVVAYVLLSGTEPFLGHGPDLVEKIREADYTAPRGVSKAARDFLKGALQPKPEKRLTASQCLAHEFLKLPCDAFRQHDLRPAAGNRRGLAGALRHLHPRMRWRVAGKAVAFYLRVARPFRKGVSQAEPYARGTPARGVRSINRTGRRYAGDGSPLCNHCDKPIADPAQGVDVMDGFLHADCFRCGVCAGLIEESYCEFQGLPCHKRCLQEESRAGPSECGACGKRMRGGVRWGGGAYHEACFVCFKCKQVVADPEDAQSYAGHAYHSHCLERERACRSESFVRMEEGSSAEQRPHPPPVSVRAPGARRVSFPSDGNVGGGQQPVMDKRAAVEMGGSGPPSPAPCDQGGAGVGAPPAPSGTIRLSDGTMGLPILSQFCHECGQKHVIATAKFCMACGTPRVTSVNPP